MSRKSCGNSSVVEHHVANVRVASSNLVSRSSLSSGLNGLVKTRWGHYSFKAPKDVQRTFAG